MPENAPVGAMPTAASMAAVSEAVDAAARNPKMLLVLKLVGESGQSSSNVGLPRDVTLESRNRIVATSGALAAAAESQQRGSSAAAAAGMECEETLETYFYSHRLSTSTLRAPFERRL